MIGRDLFPKRPHSGGCRLCVWLTASALCGCIVSGAQVFTVQREQLPPKLNNLTTVQPTSVQLSKQRLTLRTREELIRTFQSEQAFAVRPLPLGTRGLSLHANGKLNPSGHAYADELEKFGISSKPGDRLVISKFDIKPDRIVFEFNGGPEKHHRILQHIEVGGGMATMPLAQDNGQVPIGSRFTLLFDKFVPEMTGAQVRFLIAPILDFSLKTPAEAFADTLPPKLKAAILNHEVLVGMNREMVLKAVGQPDQKVRETEGSTPFEEWIYGTPPHEVQFVRFNGNRVIRMEIADVGQPLVVRDKDETDGYFGGEFVHQVRLGDALPADANHEHAPAAPPTLRNPGEKLPDAVDQDHQLKPVQFPTDDSKPAPIPSPPNQAPSPPGDPDGSNPLNGPEAPNGPNGPNGPNSTNGPNSPNGPNGPNGTN